MPRVRAAVILLLLLAGMVQAADPAKEKELTPEQRKQALRRYLQKKAGRPPTGVASPKKDAWVWSNQQYLDYEKSPQALYALISNHLLLADRRYLYRTEIAERRQGLGLGLEACRCATHMLKDKWMAIEICEVYVRPNLDASTQEHWKYLGKQNNLEAVADAYAFVEDAPKLAEVYKLMVDNAHNRNTADAARMRLAQVLARQEKYEEAIKYLKEIDDKAGVAGAKRLLPDYQAKLKAQSAKEKRP
jgi:hypothetical protein